MRDDVVGGTSQRARLLRQAISIAVDFEEFISIFRNGRGIAAHGPLPSGIFGHRDFAEDINPIVYTFDAQGRVVRRPLDDARALLAEAGYPNGVDSATGQRLILYYDTTATGPDGRAMLNWYRKQFQKLGIELVIRATDYNRFQEKMANGTAQLFSWGWNADYPDPENFLFLLYGPNARIEGMGENAANYQNPDYDALFDRMKYLPNTDERQQLIDEMITILREDAPWLWGFVPVDYVLRHAWYHNPKPNLMATNTLKYRRIDPELRKQLRAAWNTPIVWPVVLFFMLLFSILLPAWLLHRRRERSTARC
jgi:ABC-type transport system substrate-binding protein